jgi:hypothetical protein
MGQPKYGTKTKPKQQVLKLIDICHPQTQLYDYYNEEDNHCKCTK